MSDLNEMRNRLEAIKKQIDYIVKSNNILKDGSPTDVIESGLKVTSEYKGKLQREFDALAELIDAEENKDDSGQS